jgi:hypothetical protein
VGASSVKDVCGYVGEPVVFSSELDFALSEEIVQLGVFAGVGIRVFDLWGLGFNDRFC